jgi:hypothetical protein
MLLAVCSVDDAPTLDVVVPIDQSSAIMADQLHHQAPRMVGSQELATAESGKIHSKQVVRPLKMQATSQAVVSLVDGSLEAKAWGVATHLGRYTVEGAGYFIDGKLIDEGVIVAANGDKIFYTHDSGTVTLTGGTGRFEGASGGFTAAPEMVGEPIVDLDAGTMTMNFVWKATGTIKY